MVPLSRDSKFVARYDHLNYWNHTIFYIPLTASWLRRTQSQVRLPCWLRYLQCGTPGFNPWVGKNPWRREWLPTPVFLPEEFHGQRSLVGYSPWCCKRVRHNLATDYTREDHWIKAVHSLAAAAAKLLQSCPTLCDPIDGSPPGFSLPGILQARILEWAAISFSNAWHAC